MNYSVTIDAVLVNSLLALNAQVIIPHPPTPDNVLAIKIMTALDGLRKAYNRSPVKFINVESRFMRRRPILSMRNPSTVLNKNGTTEANM